MKNRISEGRAAYEDYNHGHFSKALAEWAISRMETKDPAGRMTRLTPMSLEATLETLRRNNVKVDDNATYTAWYLFNMAKADYPKSLSNDAQRAFFVGETINDPDCCPEAVLECFTAKMCAMGVPIHWEQYL